MSYYAQFSSLSGATFRFDTRIYLNGNPTSHTDRKCVAAIVGKNPGSASSATIGTWGSLNLSGDKMLPYVRNRFVEAYALAGKTVPANAFVRVWNLFYLCDKVLGSAIRVVGKMDSPRSCPSEKPTPPIIWFAWGGDDSRLNEHKKRFLHRLEQPDHVFFYDYKSEKIAARIPELTSAVKHPQGLPAQPIVEHLANIL